MAEPITQNDPQRVRELHELYCQCTGQNLSLRFDRERLWYEFLRAGFNPSFPTRGVDDPRSRSRTTSWSKGLPHKRDVLGLAQKLSARADSGRRLGRQGELELFEQQLMVGLRVSVAAQDQSAGVGCREEHGDTMDWCRI